MEEAPSVSYLRELVTAPLKDRSADKCLVVCCGGQSGADQGAMAAAKELGYPVCGFVPNGYLCENGADLKSMYPAITQTPSADSNQRTEWNCLVCDCYLTFSPTAADDSPGTAFGLGVIDEGDKPSIVLDKMDDRKNTLPKVCAWLEECMALQNPYDDFILIGIGGHRESQAPGMYEYAYGYVEALLKEISE